MVGPECRFLVVLSELFFFVVGLIQAVVGLHREISLKVGKLPRGKPIPSCRFERTVGFPARVCVGVCVFVMGIKCAGGLPS